MLLPTRLTNRRQFLERTALGAGSVLFLPGLLTSCADHQIPDPGTPVVGSPVVGDGSLSWNDEAKGLLIAGLNFIPEAGGFLSSLTSLFWGDTDVWSQVKDQVNAAIDQKLTDAIYQLVKSQLDGLNAVIGYYLSQIKVNNKDQISNLYDATQEHFVGAINTFTTSGYQVALLPLFAQFANLHLSLQRDVVIEGKRWGRSDAQQAKDIKDLQTSIFNYVNYTYDVFNTHKDYISNNVPADFDPVEPYTSVNRFIREITILALDYKTIWPYFDVTKYPDGAKVPFPRELYSDPVGSFRFNQNNPIPYQDVDSHPSARPETLTVWGSDIGIAAVQLTYPPGGGPNGVTTTDRMGRQDGPGTTDQPHGGMFHIAANNPMVRARTTTWDYSIYGLGVYSLELGIKDGTHTYAMGGSHVDHWGDWISIPDHFISSIYIHGATGNQADDVFIADCIIFGFQYLNGGPTVTSRTLERLYVTNPRELSGADLAKASPTNSAADVLITDNLKAARQAYWERIAKAPK